MAVFVCARGGLNGLGSAWTLCRSCVARLFFGRYREVVLMRRIRRMRVRTRRAPCSLPRLPVVWRGLFTQPASGGQRIPLDVYAECSQARPPPDIGCSCFAKRCCQRRFAQRGRADHGMSASVAEGAYATWWESPLDWLPGAYCSVRLARAARLRMSEATAGLGACPMPARRLPRVRTSCASPPHVARLASVCPQCPRRCRREREHEARAR